MKTLRKNLEKLNRELLEIIQRRRELSGQIQKLKSHETEEFSRWDLKREWEVFESMKGEFSKLSFKEKLAFSLLMEDHARGEDIGSYPAWSEGEHLDKKIDIKGMVNPLFLSDGEREKLKLKENFQVSLSMLNTLVMKTFDKVIAIDGPAGSGKSTIAKLLAQKIKGTYIDTGAMYRALAIGLNKVLDIDFAKKELTDLEKKQVQKALLELDFRYAETPDRLVLIRGEDLTKAIREPQVAALASQVSKFSEVREFLGSFQRGLARDQLCVMEGRDIGSVIFPNAFLKVFLTASSEERAKRRFQQFKEAGKETSYEKILEDIIKRDQADSTREAAPLKAAQGAIKLDTSDLSLSEVLDQLEQYYNKYQERI